MKTHDTIAWSKLLKKLSYYFSLLLFLGLFYACSIGKYIPEGETLYTGAEITIDKKNKEKEFKNLKGVQTELNTLLTPTPNTKVLGMRPGLYFYYKAQREKPGFLNKWLNKKFGEEPVYLSDTNPLRVEELILNRLDNRGFFYSEAQSTIDSTKKYAHISYTALLSDPYVLENYTLDKDSLPIYEKIERILKDTPIKKGDRFNLELMKFERERIDLALKKEGYYNFNPDFLIFEADTNGYDNKKFDLFLRLKKDTPKKSIVPYSIDSITVYPNYSIATDTINKNATTVNNIQFKQKEVFFKPKKLEPYILFKTGDLYDPEKARLTSNRLSSIGSYKFVNIRFKERDTTLQENDTIASLDAEIFLSPLTKRSLRTEVQGVTKSNGFAGPGIAITHNNRNLFKGGETLSITANFSYETQLSGNKQTGLSSIAGGLKADLTFPRLIPIATRRFNYAVPKTKISLGVDFLKRTQLYTLNSLNTSFGYTWNANKYVYHELRPISINYVNLSNTTPEFDAILEKNSYLKQSFDQQFIAGLTYTFTYNELADNAKKRAFFISTNVDVAGNMLQLISGGKKEVFGLEYAQYAKADIDARYYFRWANEHTLVTRIYGGWGIPYGNSATLPFVKQFYSGGPYSVRAFKIRSLGPGSFTSTDDNGADSFFDQTGNLKLEGNIEYRFPIWSYLKGAVFADAGNVWLTHGVASSEGDSEESIALNEELTTKGAFGKDWARELGIGVGFGLRVDIQSFVIRLDIASPLQTPYLPEGERIRTPFLEGGSDNLIFNFAIGYPF